MRSPIARRRGHVEFLILLVLITVLYALIMGAVAAFVWKGQPAPPRTFSILMFCFSPPGLLLELAAVIWAPFLWFMFVEQPASRVQMAVWQYPRERHWGMPRWLFDRLCTLTASLGASYSPVLILLWQDKLREATFWPLMVPCAAACILAVAITLLRAWRVSRLNKVSFLPWDEPEGAQCN